MDPDGKREAPQCPGAVSKERDEERQEQHLQEHVETEPPVGKTADGGQEGAEREQRPGVKGQAMTSRHDPILA